jgi:asparagine synthase (glutamine-hydrolysing)
MCGIIGFITPQRNHEIRERLAHALSCLYHRGPDDRGVEEVVIGQRRVVLGQTRLSIIDLSSAGHQPMTSADGRYTITFNGEVYNYRELRSELRAHGHTFRTDTDTEVLIAAWSQWGIAALKRLTGMFAFAIVDRHQQRLTLVRDAFGIKPLYYWRNTEELCFASEVPSLLTLIPTRPDPDLQSAYNYLVYGSYDCSERTFLDNVRQLPPGHTMHIDLAAGIASEPQRWWWPSIDDRSNISFDDAVEQVRTMFLNNVRLHLRSDVPLGAALSGGVDSSAVVCAMRHIEPEIPIHTFSYVARGSDVDEEHWVDIVNAHVNAIPHKVVVDGRELAEDLDDMIRAQGEPFGSTSIYAQYRVFKAAREAGIVVTLDGQGADELLAGYTGYPSAAFHSMIDRRQFLSIPGFLRSWSQWPGRTVGMGLVNLGATMTPPWARKTAYALIGRDATPPWLNADVLKQHDVVLTPPRDIVRTTDGYGRRLAEQLRAALTGNGLLALMRHGDRNSMRWSIESRVPFLTTELAEFLLRLPESYLLSPQGETKHVFRAAMRGIVPDAILDRKDKIGFQTPETTLLLSQRAKIRSWVKSAHDVPFLDADNVIRTIDDTLDGRRPYTNNVWTLINYCRWSRTV